MVNRDRRWRALPLDRFKGIGPWLFVLSGRGWQAQLSEAGLRLLRPVFMRGQPFRVQIPIYLGPF